MIGPSHLPAPRDGPQSRGFYRGRTCVSGPYSFRTFKLCHQLCPHLCPHLCHQLWPQLCSDSWKYLKLVWRGCFISTCSKRWDMEEFDCKVQASQQHRTTGTDAIIEMRRYTEERPIPCDHDPLLRWRNYEETFPSVTELGKKYLSVVATSVSAERIFSKARQLINQRRSAIKARLTKGLGVCCLHALLLKICVIVFQQYLYVLICLVVCIHSLLKI